MCCLPTTFVGPLLSLDLNSKCAFEHLCFHYCLILLIMSATVSSAPTLLSWHYCSGQSCAGKLLGKCGIDQTGILWSCMRLLPAAHSQGSGK